MLKIIFSKKNFLFYFLFLIFFSTTFYLGCKKSDNDFISASVQRFFYIPSETPSIVKQIALHLQSKNNQQNFLDQIILTEGFALWDKSEVITYANDTLVYIPLVLEKTQYVNSYIVYEHSKNISIMNLIRGRKYASYGFKEGFSANQVASDLMRLNQKVFKDSVFSITDNRLFGLDKIKGLKTPFKIRLMPNKQQNATSGISDYGSQQTSLSDNKVDAFPSSRPEDEIPSLAGPCKRTISIDGCQGFTNDTGPFTCNNVTINYTPGGALQSS